MAVLIKNGTIVTADGERKADIYAEGESITAIGEDCSQRKVMKSLMQRVNTFYLAELTSTCTFPSPTRAARPVDSKHPTLLLLAVRQLLLSS